ncbi:hypothetical protein GCM10009864_24910 [Streptomyces lunalinharesii]|uniref:Uncharacterized protein n=1 Tax=Streptomyces lunalinharesii TaxID=333384 RepID=A0ABP6E1B2_9ACTN
MTAGPWAAQVPRAGAGLRTDRLRKPGGAATTIQAPVQAPPPRHGRPGGRAEHGYPSAGRRAGRHMPHSAGPPPGSASSARTVKPKCS